MKKILIITGANRGLGKAIVDLALKTNDIIIFSLSRSLHEDHLEVSKDKMVLVPIDLVNPFSSNVISVIDKYVSSDSTLYFFNNAGVILPIHKIGNLDQEDIFKSLRINIDYPLNMINFLLKKFVLNRVVIVNITSGAGRKPVAYWSLYSSSKAFMQMFINVLKEENINNQNLSIYNIDPGTMDTDMQVDIRKTDFPRLDYFNSLKEQDKLIKPEDAAIEILEHIEFEL